MLVPQQADLVLRCIRSIMSGAARINNNAVESLLGCFEPGKLVALLKQGEASDPGKGVGPLVTSLCSYELWTCKSLLLGACCNGIRLV